jgi:hypothetical protein
MVETPQQYVGDTKRSPVVACIIGAIVSCILAAGIIVTYIPKQAPLWGPIMWVCIAAVLTVATIVLILRKEPFARRLFFTVAKWVLLHILVLTGMGEYVIAFDGVRGESARRYDHHTSAVPAQYPHALGLLGRSPRTAAWLITRSFARPGLRSDLPGDW